MAVLGKITLFMPTFLNGGVEKLFLTIAKSLENQYDIEFLFPNFVKEEYKETLKNYKVTDFNISKSHGEGKVILSLNKLRKYLNTTSSSVIIAAPGYSTIITIIANILSKKNIKVIVVLDIKISTFLESKKLYQKIIPFFAKIFFKKVDMAIVSYNKIENELISIYKMDKKQIVTIYPPLLTDSIFKKSIEDINDSFFDNSKILISVGRLVDEKGLDILIKSFSIFSTKYTKYKLAIIGSGPIENELKNLVKELKLEDKIKFFGHQINPFKFIRKSEILIVSSRWEAFGFTIIEAMALGKQVVITDVQSEGPQEIINFGEYGFISKMNSPSELSLKIIESIQNPKNPNKLIERSKLFFFQKESNLYLNTINNILGENHGK
ncbi:glycosyltransferase, family 4 [Arcobacter acticola]|uniref:Glycosyltransferase, family 4 n=1 Tax=Arcobacter acticola TaxID=1849015 RepID=A0A6M8F2X2_9BACT|nr:glycosyltransferase [Arcobacter acticola]QKE29654.1 glycosyltransferase, family 4 [Arcobacter acticola]